MTVQEETPNTPKLPGFEISLSGKGLAHSHQKVENARKRLHHFIVDSKLVTEPCRNEEDTLAYRCSCSFQIIQQDTSSKDEHTSRRMMNYAMRQNHTPVLLLGDCFPIANVRIQQTMRDLVDFFNQNHHPTQHLLTGLSSVSFVSSWSNELDCVVKLNYSQPIESHIHSTASFIQLAESLRIQAHISSLLLCSKHYCFILGNNPPYIRDVLQISVPPLPAYPGDTSHGNIQENQHHTHDDISVHVVQWNRFDETTTTPTTVTRPTSSSICVYYHKKADAFLHPNRYAMQRALEWIIQQLYSIIVYNFHYLQQHGPKNTSQNNISLLEMYCGCGAHTMAIAKTGWLHRIVAVERDERLIQACIENCKLNQCDISSSTTRTSHVDDTEKKKHLHRISCTSVEVIQGCASEWAKKWKKSYHGPCIDDKDKSCFQILLVDPPRSGLDVHVRDMMKVGPFEHILYISCGLDALQRDLEDLQHVYDVEQCLVLDLFPRTDSVETLVYLQRRGRRN